MPIYEYYCEPCHTLFSFLAPGSDSQSPACPRCGHRELPKRPSSFAMLKGQSETDDDDLFAGIDEQRFEGAMNLLMQEAGSVPEDADPKTMGHFLRRFTELSGLDMGPRLEDALARLDRGEDLEALEAEMDTLDDDDDLSELFKVKRSLIQRRQRRPFVDDELYFL